MNAQKRALAHFKATGNFDGFQDRTVLVLERKKHIKRNADGHGWAITKRGEALLAGKFGGNLPAHLMGNKGRRIGAAGSRRPKKAKKAPGAAKADRKAHEAEQAARFESEAKRQKMAERRILGPSGVAHAVKVAKADGGFFTGADVHEFTKAGWRVIGAATAPGKVGSGLAGVEAIDERDWIFTNPDELGPKGKARALILSGTVDAGILDALRFAGLDVSSAPKKLREGTTKNPAPGIASKVFNALKAASRKGQALNHDELAAKVKSAPEAVQKALKELAAKGLAHEAGRDLFGPCWAAGVPETGLFTNPSPGVMKHGPRATAEQRKAAKVAEEKARAFYQDPDLATHARELRSYKAPTSFVDIGQLVAIEYESAKFDGKERTYRHDITKERKLLISVDGSTIIVHPPLKLTKRGIEG